MSNIIQNAEKKTKVSKKQEKTIKDWIEIYTPQIKNALPKVITAERFTRMVLTAISQTPKLRECTPESFIGAMLTSAQLGGIYDI